MRAYSVFIVALLIAICPLSAQGQVDLERVLPDGIAQPRRVPRETQFVITPGGETVPAMGGFVDVEVRPERPTDRLRLRVGSTPITDVVVTPTSWGGPRVVLIGGDPLFRDLCTGGCTLPLRIGDTYELAVVSPRDGTEYGARRFETRTVRVQITARTIALEVGYDRQTRKRRRRWLTVGSMMLLGGALLGAAVPVRNACDEGPCRDRAIRLFSVGGGAAFLGLSLIGMPIVTRGRTYARLIEAEQDVAATE